MNVSVRSYLAAGAAAATATTLALAAVQVTPNDVAVPAPSVSAEPQLSQARTDLLAAANRMTVELPTPPTPAIGAAPAAIQTPGVAAIAIAPNLANTIDQIYLSVEPWVRYGFEVAAYALGWVPWVGGWAGGLLLDGYNFGQSIVASGVFNFTDWLRGDGGIATNLVDFGVDVALAFVWLGIDVANTFIPLPPIPLPPRPPLQGPFLAANLAAPTAALTTPSLPSIVGAIAALGPVLDRLGLDVVNQQLGVNDNLLNRLSIEEVGFVNDLASVPAIDLTDVLREGEGPVRAPANQAGLVADSAADHGAESADAIGDYVRDQTDLFTRDSAETDTAKVGSVPEATRALLNPTKAKEPTETETAHTLADDVQDAVKENVDKAGASVKKLGDNVRQVRQAVRGAREDVAKPTKKKPETGAEPTSDVRSDSEAAKPAKKVKAEKSDNKDNKTEKSDGE